MDEAREIHGELYDYVEESYNGSKPEMIIICKKEGHEPFPQSPDVHINAKGGCPTCANELTGERCRLKYDEVFNRLNENSKENDTTVSFNEEEYLGVNANLIIICSKHGVQEPRIVNSMLYDTHPCIECTSEILGRSFEIRSTENVNQFLNEKFEGKYKIYDFKYEDKRTVIKFNCSIEGHGDFSFQVDSMYTSNGCPICRREDTQHLRNAGLHKQIEDSLEERKQKWLNKVKKIHGEKYDYSKVEFTNVKKHVTIICKTHGPFLQTPDSHGEGQDCIKCVHELFSIQRTKTLEQFIDEAKNVHGDIYKYDNVDYKITTEKVLITCELHGDFPQTPDSHLAGHGCPRCFNKNEGRLAIILNEMTIIHRQFRIENRFFDFYLPEHGILIERDGEQHYHGSQWEGIDRKESLKHQKKNDSEKTKLAKSLGFKIYRIPYWLEEDEERTEILNILNEKPSYPDVPNMKQGVTHPRPVLN